MVDFDKNVDTITQFGPAFQSKVIASLILNGTFLGQSTDVLNPNFFESQASKWIVNKIIQYYSEYKKNPSMDYFRVEMNDLETKSNLKVEVIDQLKNSHTHFTDHDLEYVQNRFLEFAKNQTLKHAILRSAEMLQRGEYDDIKSLKYENYVFGQKSYNGVAIVSKKKLSNIKNDIFKDKLKQSRIITADIKHKSKNIQIINIYTPNGNPVDTEKYVYKHREILN